LGAFVGALFIVGALFRALYRDFVRALFRTLFGARVGALFAIVRTRKFCSTKRRRQGFFFWVFFFGG